MFVNRINVLREQYKPVVIARPFYGGLRLTLVRCPTVKVKNTKFDLQNSVVYLRVPLTGRHQMSVHLLCGQGIEK